MELPERTRVGLYRREVDAPIERVWENALDWEHLPWLHAGSFSRIEKLHASAAGWRARVGLTPAGHEILLEVVTHRDAGRYVSRTLEGPGAGTEIWTELAPRGERTGIEVAFLVPGVPPARAAEAGAGFARLYARLWDEDESMMRRRTRELAVRAATGPTGPIDLGPLVELRAKLPLLVELGGARVRVLEIAGELVAHATRCPHWLGPLEDAEVLDGGCIRCPWHGYRFDLRSGRSADGRGLRLAPAPRIEVDAVGRVTLRGA